MDMASRKGHEVSQRETPRDDNAVAFDGRRLMLKRGAGAVMLAGAGLAVAPPSWRKPLVDTVLLPAHAQTTIDGGDRECPSPDDPSPIHRLRINRSEIKFENPGELRDVVETVLITPELVDAKGWSQAELDAMVWQRTAALQLVGDADLMRSVTILKDLPAGNLTIGKTYEVQLQFSTRSGCTVANGSLAINGVVCSDTNVEIPVSVACDAEGECNPSPVGRVELSPSFIEFRQTQSARELVITHISETAGSTAPLEIRSIFITGDDARYFSLLNDLEGTMLAPGESTTLRVRIPAGLRCHEDQVGKPVADLNIVTELCGVVRPTSQLELSIECTVLED